MMFARPVAMHQLDLLGIRLVERGVVEDQEPIVQDDVLAGLSPERGGVGSKALEQASERIMGGAPRRGGLHTRGFRPGEDEWGRHQKIDVVQVSDFGLVHDATIPHNAPTA